MRKCLLSLTLVILLMGVFRQEIFEVSHALSHYFTDGHAHHSHTAHGGGSDHEHVVLDLSKSAFDVHPDAPISPDDRLKFSYDKILHVLVPQVLPPPPAEIKNRKPFPFDLQLPATPFVRTATPPPDFTA